MHDLIHATPYYTALPNSLGVATSTQHNYDYVSRYSP